MRQRVFWLVVVLVSATLGGRPAVAAEAVADDPAATYARARTAFEAGDLVTAGTLFDALVARYPDNADYLLGLGQVRLAAKDSTAAITVLERARDLAPEYADVLQVLANAYAARADEAAVRAARSRTAHLAPEGIPVFAGQPPREGATQSCRITAAVGSEATRTERNETWHESAVLVEYTGSAGGLGGFRAARSRRFGEEDSLYELFGSLPLTERVSVAARGQFSPTHRVRLERGGFVETSLVLDRGWVVTAGAGRAQYESGPSDKVAMTLERYFGRYRAAYTAATVQPEGGPWSPVHRLSGSLYYDDDSRLNLNLSVGEETDESVTGAPSLAFDTWGAGLSGRHWFTPRVAVDYAAGYDGLESDSGEHFDRTTFYVGLAFRL